MMWAPGPPWEIGEKDATENVVPGDAILTDTARTMVHSERSLVATVGVQDLIIVDTPDALLVADRHRSREVGSIVAAAARRELPCWVSLPSTPARQIQHAAD
jgi:hypothetical protein